MAEETCPGCDGTAVRAIREGREIGTYDPCQACIRRENTLDWFAVVVPPTVVRRTR